MEDTWREEEVRLERKGYVEVVVEKDPLWSGCWLERSADVK